MSDKNSTPEISPANGESRFRAVFEAAGAGIAVEDLQGKILESNRALQQMLDYTAEELQHLTRRDFTHSQDHKEDTRHFKRLLSGEANYYQAEKRFVRKDGRIIWGRLTVSMIRDAGRQPQYPIVMIEDITERQRAGEALLQYAAIVESSNDAIVSMTFDGIIFSWNPGAERLYGYSARDVNGRSIALTLPPDQEEEFTKILERIRRGERVEDFETKRVRKDGAIIDVAITLSPIKDAEGKITAASSISRDITGRKRAEAENQKLAAFPQFNPNPVLEFSPEKLNYFNAAALQMAQSLDRQHPSEVLPPNVFAIVRECLASGQSQLRHETVVQGRTISWSFFPVPAIGVVHCYAGDITDRQILEAQLRQSQKMESVGQLAGGIAHDFNNILTVIQGHASLLTLASKLPPETVESAQQIVLAAERAANLTRQLLAFSRRQVLQPKKLDLNEVVNNMTKMLRRLLGEDITLQVNYASSLPLVQADPGMLEQILMNLVVNARDAMPRGGKLFVDTSVLAIDYAYVLQNPEARVGDHVCLTVRDTGEGIAPENLARIFEPFFTTKDVGKGTGLGLATVYGIVQQHRGWIKVASQLGKETVFQIFLPAIAAQATAAETAVVDAAIPGGSETILVVEDEEPLRRLVCSLLKRFGYQVLDAGSGVAALPVWNEHKAAVRLLLTDMVMPHGLSGRELAERLQREKPALKVIYSSGYSLAVVGSDMVLREGINFLQKPYHPRKLAQAIRDCLDGP